MIFLSYPSADHYAHAQILTQLGLDEVSKLLHFIF